MSIEWSGKMRLELEHTVMRKKHAYKPKLGLATFAASQNAMAWSVGGTQSLLTSTNDFGTCLISYLFSGVLNLSKATNITLMSLLPIGSTEFNHILDLELHTLRIDSPTIHFGGFQMRQS